MPQAKTRTQPMLAIAKPQQSEQAMQSSLTATVELISPVLAKQYLKTQKNNRRLNQNRVELYAKDMAADDWELSPQGISFDKDGCLIDGQHRLEAIILSGKSVLMLVIRGCDPQSKLVLDSGQSRTVNQSLAIAGFEASKLEGSILKAMFASPENADPRGITRKGLAELFPKYRESLRFAAESFSSRGIKHAIPRAIVARAHYCDESSERLMQFLRVLDTGFTEGTQDNQAIALRNFFLTKKRGDYAFRVALLKKTITALQNFLNEEPKTVLREAVKMPNKWRIADFDEVAE